jgi:hypothetical protein
LTDATEIFEASASRSPDAQLAQAALGLLRLERGEGDGLDAIHRALAALRADGHDRSNAHAEILGFRTQAAVLVGDIAAARTWQQHETEALTALLGEAHPRVFAARAACRATPAGCPRSRP